MLSSSSSSVTLLRPTPCHVPIALRPILIITNPTISCRYHCPSWPRHFVLLVLLDQALLDQVSQALLVVLDQALGLASFGMNPAATAVSEEHVVMLADQSDLLSLLPSTTWTLLPRTANVALF